MKYVLILIYLFHSINTRVTKPSVCKDCVGKIHTTDELQLAKQSPIINKIHTCQSRKYKFIIIVKSGHFQRRSFTRSTWAEEITQKLNTPILYAIGYPNGSSTQDDIISEDEQYQDLLEFNILDSYYNLTIKTTSILLWYDQYCSKNSDYLLYVDDDVLVHVDRLITYIYQINDNNSIKGWFEKSAKIQRTGIGGVSKKDFPIDTVPDYLWGAAVLYPSTVISNVLIKAIFNATMPIFFRDDVFINGFIAEQAGIKRQHMQGVVLYDWTEDSLKTNMIIIDFKSEEAREKAWNCYKYHIQCSKMSLLFLFKILCGAILFTMVVVYRCKWLIRTSYYNRLRYEFNRWYIAMDVLFMNCTNSILATNKKHSIV